MHFFHSILLVASIGTFGLSIQAEDLPYSGEIEQLRNADEKSVERLTHLLSLKAIARNWMQENEIVAASRYLEKHPDKSALYALESLLEFPVSYRPSNFQNSQSVLSKAWLAVATDGLDDKQKIDVLVNTCLPKFPARVQRVALDELSKLKGGADALYKGILSSKGPDISMNDFLRIGEILGKITSNAIPKPSKEDVRKMAESDVLFQQVFATQVLLVDGSAQAEDLMLKLISLDVLKKQRARYQLINDLGYFSSKERLFSKIVTHVLGEPRTSEAGEFLLHTILRLGVLNKDGRGRDVAVEALKNIASIELKIPDTWDNQEDYTVLQHYNAARIEARKMLKNTQ